MPPLPPRITPVARRVNATRGQRLASRLRDRRFQADTRHIDADFSSDETNAFLESAAVQCISSNVDWVRWDTQWEDRGGYYARSDYGTFYIVFKNGYAYSCEMDRSEALGFAAAPSKGGYVHDWLIGRLVHTAIVPIELGKVRS